MITALAASQAYAAAAKTTGLESGPGHAAGAGGGGFADMLKSAMTDAMQASKNAETQMTNHVQGKGDLVNVVTAISSAEASLETVMAVRDQVISAYQEIMRMPI